MPFHRFVDGRDLVPPVWWPCGSVGTRKRIKPYRIMLWHWSAGSRGVDGIGIDETLHNRKLSIHDVLETSGRCVACCDPNTTVAFHAGIANSASRGCEIVGSPAHDFTSEQYETIGLFADSLSLPRCIWMPGDDLRTFAGHMEHRNVPKTTKIDAGGRVLRFLAARWGLPAPR